jgi:hypothetical protein
MRGFVLNLGKWILSALVLSNVIIAEGIPFRVSSSALAPTTTTLPQGKPTQDSDPEANLINDLKFLAVSNWLQTYLGPKYSQFERFVTPEFAEKYILDYKVNHSNQPTGNLDLIGHLDGDSLKKWVRLVESKAKGSNQIKPLFIMSSNLPDMIFSPSDTSTNARDSHTGQVVEHLTQQQFQKLNAKIYPLDSLMSFESPPRSNADIQSLTAQAARLGYSMVIWEAFTTCPGCTQNRFDIFVYNNSSQNLSFVTGDDVQGSVKEWGNTELLKKSLTPVFQQLQAELENAFSEGMMQEVNYKLVIDGVDSYRALKVAESELEQESGFSNPVFKKAVGKTAEYQIRTALSLEELIQKIQGTPFPGYKSQVSRLDSTTVLLRLSK